MSVQEQFGIRLATGADAEAIAQMVNDAYWNHQQGYLERHEGSLRTSVSEVRNLIETKKVFIVVASKTNRVAGSILYDSTKGKQKASFGLFATHVDYQGQRLGSRLVRFVEAHAAQEGKTEMEIEVLGLAGRLQAYYRRLEYQATDQRMPFAEVSQAKLKPEYVDSTDAYYLTMRKRLDSRMGVKC
ncbi:MAG: hypothetical protein S4CHLAM2_18700 [Chlamydiales bacterium]|nr:hypothetical protein [Chlamydiales bacterium]